jgi:hypothetical protein
MLTGKNRCLNFNHSRPNAPVRFIVSLNVFTPGSVKFLEISNRKKYVRK